MPEGALVLVKSFVLFMSSSLPLASACDLRSAASLSFTKCDKIHFFNICFVRRSENWKQKRRWRKIAHWSIRLVQRVINANVINVARRRPFSLFACNMPGLNMKLLISLWQEERSNINQYVHYMHFNIKNRFFNETWNVAALSDSWLINLRFYRSNLCTKVNENVDSGSDASRNVEKHLLGQKI